MSERRKFTRYPVNWQGRILLADRSLSQVPIRDISKGGVAIHFDRVLAVNTPVNIEFFAPSVVGRVRIRAKTIVAHHTLLSSGLAQLGLLFKEMSNEDAHSLGNILQQLTDQRG